MKTSDITVKNILDMYEHNIGPIKIIYNSKIIWDDDWEDSINIYNNMLKLYGNKSVYYYNTSIVMFHHCELNIVGE